MFGRRSLEDKVVALPVRNPASAKPATSSGAEASARKAGHTAAPVDEPYEIKSNEYYE